MIFQITKRNEPGLLVLEHKEKATKACEEADHDSFITF